MGLGAEGIDNAIGIVVNLSPTCMAYTNEEGNNVKWLIGGQSCTTGVLAAEMAARGTKGMRGVVPGWIPVISKDCHPERLTEGIRADGTFEQWEIDSGILTKHYATVGPLTAALDATFALVHEHDIHADDIVEIHVDAMHRTAMFDKVHPETEIAARASLAYCLALAVVSRDPAQLLGPGFAPDKLRDTKIWENAEKVKVTESDEYERQYPDKSLAKVTLRLRNGKSYSLESDRSANPRYLRSSDADIEKKFRMIATPVLGKGKTDRVVELAQKLETLPDVNGLIEALRL
jgi:2-methylcitrate dehydratase PrpD